MIISILAFVLFITFTILGSFHFYWFFGGKWGLESVIPSKPDQDYNLTIPRFATLVVALTLFLFGLLYLLKTGWVQLSFPKGLKTFAYWFVPSIFILRGVGEFKYVGLFKKIKNTKFAKADSKLFVPLCLAIGIMGLLIQILS